MSSVFKRGPPEEGELSSVRQLPYMSNVLRRVIHKQINNYVENKL